jgi:hypothetical protein
VLDAQAAVFDDHVSVDDVGVLDMISMRALLAYVAISATVFKARQVGALWMDVLLVESLSRLQYPSA